MLDGDLAAVHEVDDEAEVGVADAAEDDGRVVAGVGGQELLEEAAARRQQDLVALDGPPVGRGQRRVHELLGDPAVQCYSQFAISFPINSNGDKAKPEPVEDAANVGVVVVPLEAVLLREAVAAVFIGGGGGRRRRGHVAHVRLGMSRVEEERNVVEFLLSLWRGFLLEWNVVARMRPCAAV